MVIATDMFQSSLGLNEKKGKKKHIDSIEEDELENNSLNLFMEMEDLELEDDMMSMEKNYEEQFYENKNKICELLDQVLFDLNCVNFFDKNQRNKVNNYFDVFKTCLIQVIGDLRANFSKM